MARIAILIVALYAPLAFAQAEPPQGFEERLKALEERLGISTDQPADIQPSLLERLEALEQAVYGEDQPEQATEPTQAEAEAVAPPPETGNEFEWKAWDSDEDAPQPVMDDLAMPQVSRFFSGYGKAIDFSGYAWVSYYWDDKRDVSTFNANALELDITAELTDWSIMGADLDFFNENLDAILLPFRHPEFGDGDSGPYGGTSSGGDDDDDFVLEQLFIKFRPADPLEITAGKFNVPTGLEARDAADRYTVMPSLLFPLWPRDLTGVMATYQVNDRLSVSPYVFNGWDGDENVNDSFLFAIHNRFQAADPIEFRSTVAYGPPFPNNNVDDALLLDFEARYTGIERLWAGAEFLYGVSESDHVPGFKQLDEISFWGALGIVHYDFMKYFGMTLQGSYVDDVDGFLYGRPQERWEFSLIPTIYLAEGLELRFQYQHLESTERILFEQKDPTNRWSKSDDVFAVSAWWWF